MREVNARLRHRHSDEPHGHHHHEHAPGEHAHAHAHSESAAHGDRPHVDLTDVDLEGQRAALARGAGSGQLLYVDAFSGAGGDMCVAALIDLGVPFEVVSSAVEALGLHGVHLHLHPTFAGAIGALGFEVHSHGAQPQRSYAQIRALIDGAPLLPGVRELAQRIFLRLARAEARVHRVSVDEVHFHEVGAVDSLADIVGAAAAFEHLGARVICSALPLGRGFVQCQHGPIPVPAPATVVCLEGLWTIDAPLNSEMVTPTAAAVLAEVAQPGHWPAMRPTRTGWGAGKRAFADRPNALRLVLGEPLPALDSDAGAQFGTHQIVETNLDDVSGEVLGHAVEALLRAGALDAWASPCTMKKGRPAWVLSALGTAARVEELAQVILRETPAIGVRIVGCTRRELPRQLTHVDTAFGRVPVKVSGVKEHGTAHAKPEFGVCQELASHHRVPVRVVWEAALKAALDQT